MIPYFDAHCDTITAVLESGAGLEKNSCQLDLARLSAFSPAAQVFAVWGGRYEEKAALLRRELGSSARAALCRSIPEAREAQRRGRIAAMLSVEGMEQLQCSAERLRLARERDGVIMINLCWNEDNVLCGAALGGGGGLTAAGRELVAAAQAMGVAIDLSHASERTFWDVLEAAEKPVLASHSNLRSICPHPRNLTEKQFSALVSGGGGAGLNLCPDFLGTDPGVEDCVAHLERFLELGGAKAVFIGADLDGIDSLPRGMEGVQSLGLIYEAMLRRNHGEALLRDIFHNNLMDILERTE